MTPQEALRREAEGTLDWNELEELLLTPQQRELLRLEVAREGRRPRWDLDPPQRESYNDPIAYVLGLGKYADRVLKDESR